MKKWKCKLCGEIVEAEAAPAACPLCKQPNAFEELETELTWASERHTGLPDSVPEELTTALNTACEAECRKAGLFMAIAGVASEDGFPEISSYMEKASVEASKRAGRLLQLMGDSLSSATDKNLESSLEAASKSCSALTSLAKTAKVENLDEIHDLLHEMAREVATHGKSVEGLLTRYFS